MRLRVGIVGCGAIARRSHLPAWRRIPQAQVVAVCDRNPDAVDTVRAALPGAQAYDEMSEMLRREALDIVDICTPPGEHCVQVAAVLEAGAHVLVEKPMTVTLPEANDVVSRARRAGRKVGVVHNFLFWPSIVEAGRRVAAGRLGTVTGFDMAYAHARDDPGLRTPGHWYHSLPLGFFTHLLPHPIYLTEAFLGPVEDVLGVAVDMRPGNPLMSFDHLRVLFRCARGLSTLSMSCFAPSSIWVNIVGTEATLSASGGLLLETRGGDGYVRKATSYVSHGLQTLGSVLALGVRLATGRYSVYIDHANLIRSFVDAVIHDAEPPVGVEAGHRTVEVMVAITERVHSLTLRPSAARASAYPT